MVGQVGDFGIAERVIGDDTSLGTEVRTRSYAQELNTGVWCLQMGNGSLQVKVSD